MAWVMLILVQSFMIIDVCQMSMVWCAWFGIMVAGAAPVVCWARHYGCWGHHAMGCHCLAMFVIGYLDLDAFVVWPCRFNVVMTDACSTNTGGKF